MAVMKKPKRTSTRKGQKAADREFVGPEGQGFAGHDARPADSERRKENPAANQFSDPKLKEGTEAHPHEDLPRDLEERNLVPDYRHN
jgi:hypothetical protein